MKQFKIKLTPEYRTAVNIIKSTRGSYHIIMDLSYLNLKRLPKLPNNLHILFCNDNKLRKLPDLSQFSTLQELWCHNNKLTSLPDLPNSLLILNCSINKLISLPDLPTNLKRLYCNMNQLTNISDLPNTLQTLHCENNKLTSLTNLPYLPNSLQELYCRWNKLTKLPILCHTYLKYLDCISNKLTSLPTLPNTLQTLYCDEIKNIKLNSSCIYINNKRVNNCKLCNHPIIPSEIYCDWKCKWKYKCGWPRYY